MKTTSSISIISSLNRSIVIAASTVTLSLGTVAPALAEYVPPPQQSAPRSGSTTTNVARGGGCSAASTTGLIPLAPQTHIGQTQHTQPTFVWFTPEREPYLVEFRIAEHLPDGQFRVVYATEFESSDRTLPSGITTMSLSETDISLSPDKTYRWQVVLVCNPNRPSESLVAEADIVVVNPSSSLNAALSTATAATERANLYAEAGLWYDAMAEALSIGPGTQSIHISLLEDLAALEEQQDRAGNHSVFDLSFSDRLRQVIAAIR